MTKASVDRVSDERLSSQNRPPPQAKVEKQEAHNKAAKERQAAHKLKRKKELVEQVRTPARAPHPFLEARPAL